MFFYYSFHFYLTLIFIKYNMSLAKPLGLFNIYEILKRSKSRDGEGRVAITRKNFNLYRYCNTYFPLRCLLYGIL